MLAKVVPTIPWLFLIADKGGYSKNVLTGFICGDIDILCRTACYSMSPQATPTLLLPADSKAVRYLVRIFNKTPLFISVFAKARYGLYSHLSKNFLQAT